MKPTDQLVEEHSTIQVMLRVLEAVAERLEAGQQVDAGQMESMVEFIRLFADRFHHGKEEDLLFSAMEAAGIPRDGGPIGVMLEEHDEGRGYVKAMSEGIASYRDGNPDAARTIAASARRYAGLLADHIEKENGMLYPMADSHIPPEKQQELLHRFSVVEAEKIGPGRADHFRDLVGSLEQTYLS